MGEENTSTTRTTVGIRKRDSSGDQCPLHTWPKWHSWEFERTLMDIVWCMLITSGPFLTSGVKLSHAVFIHKQSYFQNWWAYSLWLLEREETHLSEIRIFGPRAFIREPLVSSNWNHEAKKYTRTFNVLEKIFIKIEPLLLLLSLNLKNGPVWCNISPYYSKYF